MTRSPRLALAALALVSLLAVEIGEAWGRARAGGSRGSRSYATPARPAPSTPGTPSSPAPGLGQPVPAAARPAPLGGFVGPLAGFAMGGLIGGLLFGGAGHGAGIGLLDILLIGGGIMLVMSFLRRRREQPVAAYAGGGPSAYGQASPTPPGRMEAGPAAAPADRADRATDDLARGTAHIQVMDPGFDAVTFAAGVPAVFRAVQGAVAARDIAPLEDDLTPEMYGELRAQAAHLRRTRRTNRVEKIEIKRSEVSEAWQEGGRDFVTVFVSGSLLDYVVDDAGTVVEGSRTVPSDFEEFWTFSRRVGNNRWKLSAIQAA